MITIQKTPFYWHLLFGGFFLFTVSDCFYNYIFIDNKLFRMIGLLGILCILIAYIYSLPFYVVYIIRQFHIIALQWTADLCGLILFRFFYY